MQKLYLVLALVVLWVLVIQLSHLIDHMDLDIVKVVSIVGGSGLTNGTYHNVKLLMKEPLHGMVRQQK